MKSDAFEAFMVELHSLAEQLGGRLWRVIEKQGERARAQALELAKQQLRAEIQESHVVEEEAEAEPGPAAVEAERAPRAHDRAALPTSPIGARREQRAGDRAARRNADHDDHARDLGRPDRATKRGPQRCRTCVAAGRPGLGHNAKTCGREPKTPSGDDSEDESQPELKPERGAQAPPPTELRVPADGADVPAAAPPPSAPSAAPADPAAGLDGGAGPSRGVAGVERDHPEPQMLTPTITAEPTVHRRRRHVVASAAAGITSYSLRRLDKAIAELDAGEDLGPDQVAELEAQRPRTRGDCVDGPRPCVWVRCRHHLAFDVSADGLLQLELDGRLDVEAFAETCSLDVADRGEHTLEQVGRVLNLTKERVRQIEARGLERAADNARAFGVRADALPLLPDRDHPPEM